RLRTGKDWCPHLGRVATHRINHHRLHLRITLYVPRNVLVVQTDQVVKDEYLTIRVRARPDTDHRRADASREGAGNGGRHRFGDDREAAGRVQGLRRSDNLERGVRRAAVDAEALAISGLLRREADVAHDGDA